MGRVHFYMVVMIKKINMMQTITTHWRHLQDA